MKVGEGGSTLMEIDNEGDPKGKRRLMGVDDRGWMANGGRWKWMKVEVD